MIYFIFVSFFQFLLFFISFRIIIWNFILPHQRNLFLLQIDRLHFCWLALPKIHFLVRVFLLFFLLLYLFLLFKIYLTFFHFYYLFKFFILFFIFMPQLLLAYLFYFILFCFMPYLLLLIQHQTYHRLPSYQSHLNLVLFLHHYYQK